MHGRWAERSNHHERGDPRGNAEGNRGHRLIPILYAENTAGRHGTALFQKSCSTSYEEAAEAARAIIDGLAGKTESEKLYAFACSVCDRLEYDESSTATPRALFATDGVKKGNCMSYAHGFQFLCNLADIPCILVHSDVHQWNEVYTNGRWYSVDLTGFKIGYSERGSATLLHDNSELIGSMYFQSEPQLTRFAKELCVPNSTI